jgi:hypothetical protein
LKIVKLVYRGRDLQTLQVVKLNEDTPQQATGYQRGSFALKIRDFQTSEYLSKRSKLRGIRPVAIEKLATSWFCRGRLTNPDRLFGVETENHGSRMHGTNDKLNRHHVGQK